MYTRLNALLSRWSFEKAKDSIARRNSGVTSESTLICNPHA